MTAVEMAYEYFLDDNPVDASVYQHLNNQGIFPNSEESDDIGMLIDSINAEMKMIRTIRFQQYKQDVYNRLVYGY